MALLYYMATNCEILNLAAVAKVHTIATMAPSQKCPLCGTCGSIHHEDVADYLVPVKHVLVTGNTVVKRTVLIFTTLELYSLHTFI